MTWLLWIIASCVFAIAEMVTMGLFLAPFALGAAVAATIAGIGGGLVPTLVSFAVTSALVLFTIRPLVLSHRRLPIALRTGTAALIGARAAVTERIAESHAGSVRIGGEVWTARAYGEEVIEAGTTVTVIEIRGATAWVTE
jgi:membrane protein implicated in regulation of membrane protease activity